MACSEALWKESSSFPIWFKNEKLFPSLTSFQFQNPSLMNTWLPEFPVGLSKRKHGRQKATSLLGEYSSHVLNALTANHECLNLREWLPNLVFLDSSSLGWYGPSLK